MVGMEKVQSLDWQALHFGCGVYGMIHIRSHFRDN
jgi:hypothetical protein